MKVSSRGNYSVYIDDVNFDEMTDDQWMEIGKIHMANLVTIIRNCNVKQTEAAKYVNKWGPVPIQWDVLYLFKLSRSNCKRNHFIVTKGR